VCAEVNITLGNNLLLHVKTFFTKDIALRSHHIKSTNMALGPEGSEFKHPNVHLYIALTDEHLEYIQQSLLQSPITSIMKHVQKHDMSLKSVHRNLNYHHTVFMPCENQALQALSHE
jgi:hypothetical protein